MPTFSFSSSFLPVSDTHLGGLCSAASQDIHQIEHGRGFSFGGKGDGLGGNMFNGGCHHEGLRGQSKT